MDLENLVALGKELGLKDGELREWLRAERLERERTDCQSMRLAKKLQNARGKKRRPERRLRVRA